MPHRLMGQETEYALRFSPQRGSEHPGNVRLYRAFERAIRQLVDTKQNSGFLTKNQFFTSNGGAFCYENLPFAEQGGLLEGSTPECLSASEVLKYQRAQEALLIQALPIAKEDLEKDGIKGVLGLIKNCRDAHGNTYGAQENYEVEITHGLPLIGYRVAVLATVLLFWMIYPAFFIVLMIILFSHGLLSLVVPFLIPYGFSVRRALIDMVKEDEKSDKQPSDYKLDIINTSNCKKINSIVAFAYHTEKFVQTLVLAPTIVSLQLVGFKKQRRAITTFLVTRPIFSGAGCLLPDGMFCLSEKGNSLQKIFRMGMDDKKKSVFDVGNIYKNTLSASWDVLFLRFNRLASLLRKNQRLQLGYSDSNRADVGEYLKLGTTQLVLEMVEKGYLNDAPELTEPLLSAQHINEDPLFLAKHNVNGDRRISAIQLQKYYMEKAKIYLASSDSIALDHHRVVKMWARVLGLLETNRDALVGQIDWITKQYLLRNAGCGAEYVAKKKIDIAYHELGTGYFDLLTKEGLVTSLVSSKQIEYAIRTPSSPEVVRQRSHEITRKIESGKTVTVAWDRLVTKQWLRGNVILFKKRCEKSVNRRKRM